MFSFISKTIDAAFQTNDSRRTLLLATYNDPHPTSDAEYDVCIKILLGHKDDVTRDEALKLIPGRLHDEWHNYVILKVLLLFRSIIVSHYVTKADLFVIFGKRAILTSIKDYRESIIPDYCDALDYWIKQATQNGLLDKDQMSKLSGIWGDVKVNTSWIKSNDTEPLLDNLYTIYTLCRKLMKCFIIFEPFPRRSSNRRMNRDSEEQDSVVDCRKYKVIIRQQQDFSSLIMTFLMDTTTDVSNYMKWSKNILEEISDRSEYRMTDRAHYKDFLEFVEEHIALQDGIDELICFVAMSDDTVNKQKIELRMRSEDWFIHDDDKIVQSYNRCNNILKEGKKTTNGTQGESEESS